MKNYQFLQGQTRTSALALTVILSASVLPVLAEHGDRSGGEVVRDVAEVVLSEVLFGDRDRRILDDYLRSEYHEVSDKKHKKQKKLPPGLRKKLDRGGSLPPGWQTKINRWEVMDETVYGHSEALPEHILRQLSSHPAGTSVRRVEDRIVRVMDATHTILDVLAAGRGDY